MSERLTLPWADGEYTFVLNIGELIELQDKCKAGPFEVLARLLSSTCRVEDIREPIRLGLIGGGVEPGTALSLVRRYCDPYLGVSMVLAQAILSAALWTPVSEGEMLAGEPPAVTETAGSR